MPCTPDTSCTTTPTDQSYTSTPNLQAPSPTVHYANMGWVGYVFFRSNKLNADNILRVTRSNINLKQTIEKPPTIDGRIDKTIYQLGPKIVDGDISMPVVIDVQNPDSFGGCPNTNDLINGVAGSVLNNLWCWTASRGNHGRLLYDDVKFDIRFANHAAYTFDNCVCNTFGLQVSYGGMVELNLNVMGRGRQRPSNPLTDPIISDYLSPARVLTWDGVTVNAVGGCGPFDSKDLFFSNSVRSWSLNINNNADRFYSLNGSLFPIDVAAGKREITGSLTLLGVQDRLRKLAEENQNRFTEKNELRFAFYVGESTEVNTPNGIAFTSRDWKAGMTTPPGNPIFYRKLSAVVFEIETVELKNEVLESNVNYHGLASDQTNYEAMYPENSCSFPAWT